MRKFTKEHNEIGWLFPSVLPEDNPEKDFNTFEERGKILFEQAYQGKETFTKDDMMDAFMKGCSVAQQYLSEKYGYIIHTVLDEAKRNREIMKDVKEILSSININSQEKLA